MKRLQAISVLALPLLASATILYITLVSGFGATTLKEYAECVLMYLGCDTMFNVQALFWFPYAILSFFVGTVMLMSSKSRKGSIIVTGLGLFFAMQPVLVLALALGFLEYRGP